MIMVRHLTAVFAFLLATLSFTATAQAKDNAFFGFMDWDQEQVQAAIDQGDRVVVNVWASWCPKCTAQRRALSQVLGADPSLDDVKVFAIDIDDPLRPSSVGSHSISGNAARTTLVIFDQGQEVAVYGGRDAAAIAALFD